MKMKNRKRSVMVLAITAIVISSVGTARASLQDPPVVQHTGCQAWADVTGHTPDHDSHPFSAAAQINGGGDISQGNGIYYSSPTLGKVILAYGRGTSNGATCRGRGEGYVTMKNGADVHSHTVTVFPSLRVSKDSDDWATGTFEFGTKVVTVATDDEGFDDPATPSVDESYRLVKITVATNGIPYAIFAYMTSDGDDWVWNSPETHYFSVQPGEEYTSRCSGVAESQDGEGIADCFMGIK